MQGLVGQDRKDEIGLEEIIHLDLRACVGREGDQVFIAGPLVVLPVERFQGLALVLPELTANTVEYGALKEGQGLLNMRWEVALDEDPGPVLVLDWHKSGIATPEDPSRRGYGRVLIERVLPRLAGSRTAFTLGADDVACRIKMPVLS